MACLVASQLCAASGRAQEPTTVAPAPDDPLSAARKLFSEALQDEDEGRPGVALDKFRRVREVRDTAAVEYRIGRCLEDLGRAADAVSAYDQAVVLSRQGPAPADVEADAIDRSAALGKGLARLTLVLSRSDARVLIDDKPAARVDDVPLAPGPHHIQAVAPGAAVFDGDVTLPPGGRATIKVSLDTSGSGASSSSSGSPGSSQTTWGWLAIATGGALLVGAGVSAGERESDIQTINRLCPGGACRGSIDPGAQAAVNRAQLEGPLAFALGAAGMVTAGVGIVLLTTRTSPSVLSVTSSVGAGSVGLSLRGAL